MGESGQTIRRQVADRFGYDMDRNVDHCRMHHQYNETCQHCVPEAIICALEAQSYEDAIRNAISLGGDADTLAPISGGIAEAIFGIPEALIDAVQPYLNDDLKPIIEQFYQRLEGNH